MPSRVVQDELHTPDGAVNWEQVIAAYVHTRIGWALLLAGSILVCLFQTPRRFGFCPWILFAAGVLLQIVATVLESGGMPRRYHYYYVTDDLVSRLRPWQLGAWLLVIAGLLMALIPTRRRPSDRPPGP